MKGYTWTVKEGQVVGMGTARLLSSSMRITKIDGVHLNGGGTPLCIVIPKKQKQTRSGLRMRSLDLHAQHFACSISSDFLRIWAISGRQWRRAGSTLIVPVGLSMFVSVDKGSWGGWGVGPHAQLQDCGCLIVMTRGPSATLSIPGRRLLEKLMNQESAWLKEP